MKKFQRLFLYRENTFKPYIDKVLMLLDGISCFASVVLILCVVFKYGFVLTVDDQWWLNIMYKSVWIVFLVDLGLNIVLDFHGSCKRYKKVAWFTNFLLILTLVPACFSRPYSNQILSVCWDVLASDWYNVPLLLLLSVQKLASVLVGLLGKHTNPSQILAVSFLSIILIGSGLLLLPRCTYDGITLSWVDSFFISTSAVCVTGLVPLDVSTTFTPMGLTIIILLIQIGGVGVMTLTSFFAMFFMGNTSIYNQLVVRDMVSSNSLNSLLSTMWHILLFTLGIEALGMVCILFSVHGTLNMTLKEELAFSAFHSISAFCNAGFSTLSGNLGNEMLVHTHTWFYIFIAFLIILGGIGFPLLVNFKHIVKYHLLRMWSVTFRGKPLRKEQHIYDLNTKIVLWVTGILLIGGTLVFLCTEWNHAFAEMTVGQKITHAFFNAACPRTAGFNSVDLTALTVQSLFFYLLLMWIGGASQSTAGGVKVNAFAVSVLNLVSVLRGKDRVEVYGRQISDDSIRRSNATVVLSFIVLFVAIFILTILEPDISPVALSFECISALSTVGSSLNITNLLGSPAKMVLSAVMFIGRVGLLTLMLGFVRKQRHTHYAYPSGEIIIN